jgi:hypothetical protein
MSFVVFEYDPDLGRRKANIAQKGGEKIRI